MHSTLGMFIYGLNAGCNQVYARTLAFATLATAEVIETARSETVILSKIGVFSNRAVTLGTLASFC